MRWLALAVAMTMAGCGGDGCPPTVAEGAAHLYRIDDTGVSCDGATYRDESPGRVLCGWECVTINGRLARYIFLDFGDSPEWHLSTVSVEYSRTAECD